MSGLRLRHHGTHLPDFVRKLDAVGGGADARVFRQSLVALHPPRRPATLSPSASANDFAAIFTNLTVWIDAAVRASTFHAGPAKLQLYVTFLRVLVAELMPDDRLHVCVQQIDAYVSYLLDAEREASAPVTSPSGPDTTTFTDGRNVKPATSYVSVKMSPAPRHQPMTVLLSPRVLQQIRRAEPPARENQSPTLQPTRQAKPRTLIELSDHEEAVLELALFFQESVEQLVASQRSGGIGSIGWASRPRPAHSPPVSTKARNLSLLTGRWPQLTAEAKKRALTEVKRNLSRQKFFSSSDPTSKAKPDVANASNAGRIGGGQRLAPTEEHLRNGRAVPAPHTKIDPSRFLSLVLLCLHETIRRVNVFTQELAQFAWLHLCEQPIEEFERALAAVETQRETALDELQRLRSAKQELQSAIREYEARIQRLQTRSMASVRLWQLEQREAEHFAREEQWHGHCKALMLRSLKQLAKEGNVPTWCELNDGTGAGHRGGGSKDGDGVSNAKVVVRGDDFEQGSTAGSLGDQSSRPNHLALVGSPGYESLAPGAALLDARLRFQLMYVVHLLILCRSYLHLHERRAARDVVEATATTIAMLGAEAEDTELATGTTPTQSMRLDVASDSPPASPTSASHLIARISRHELETLRELSEALRSIEVVYAATTSERPLAVSGVVTAHGNHFRLRDATTQFPEALGDSSHDSHTSPRAFLRSLAYCTIAATSFASATAFVPAAIDLTGSYHNVSNAGTTNSGHAGSGRRSGSAMFKAQGLTIDSLSEQQQQLVMLRLDRAVHKLPKHMKELLLLLPPSPSIPVSVLNGNHDRGSVTASPFAPASSTTGVGNSVVALSGDELVVRIQAIYSRLAEATSASASASPLWSVPASSSALSQQMQPPLGISLAGLVPGSQSKWPHLEPPSSSAMRSPEALVREVYALFLDAADGTIELAEREFARFFASIQLIMSKAVSSSTPSPPSPVIATAGAARAGGRLAAPACHEIIHLFAILTKLYYLPASARSAAFVPRRLFAAVTYCQRVLEQVAVNKKRLQVAGGGGNAFDIWVAASSSPSSSWKADPPLSVFYTADVSNSPSTSTPPTPTSAQKPPAPSLPPQPYVLLDSAKLLLVHVAGISTSHSSSASLEDSARLLEGHAVATTVSLANATTPAPYQIVSSTSKAASAGHYHQPNGLLTDAQIVPLQAAVAVIARAWLKRIEELHQPLRIAFRAALRTDRGVSTSVDDTNSDEGHLSFFEFLHVMTNGQPHTLPVRASVSSSASPSPWESTASAGGGGELSYSRLAQLYANAVTADGVTRTSKSSTSSTEDDPSSLLLGVRWTTLARVVADELDLTNTMDRFAVADMRSIEHAVIGPAARSGGSGAVAVALQDISTLAASTRQFVLLPWLLRPPYTCPSDAEGSTAATVAALRKSWAAHRSNMTERFAEAAQADGSAIDGVLSWQSGQQRSRLVDKLLSHQQDVAAISVSDDRKRTVKCKSNGGASMPGGASGTGTYAGGASDESSSRKPTAVASVTQHEKLNDDLVGVMWTSYYYLQLENARAHQLVEMADRAANKQQQPTRLQKTNTAAKMASSTAPAGQTAATSPAFK